MKLKYQVKSHINSSEGNMFRCFLFDARHHLIRLLKYYYSVYSALKPKQ